MAAHEDRAMITTMPTVRIAVDGDRAAIAELVELALAEYRLVDAVVHEGYLRYSLAAWGDAGAEQLVAEESGRIAGAVLFDPRVRHRAHWPRTLATFGTLVVDPSMRRRGIGGALIAACIERAKEAGASGLAIETMPFMTAGQAVYGPFGFERWPAGDWDGTGLLAELIGREDAPETILSAWRLDFD
jgi:predicted N-acetyltransferase YhbS